MATTEYSLTVPVDFVKRTNGLTIDIGGSLVKIVYRSKGNLEEAESKTTGADGHLQLVSFPKSKLTEALEYIQQRAKITRNGREEPPEIFTTGIGCAKLGKTVCETLNIRLNNILEFDCFVKAFIHLASKWSRKDFLEQPDLEVAREAEAEIVEELGIFVRMDELELTEGFHALHFNLNVYQQLTRDGNCPSDGPLAQCEDIYPCILAMCGSGIGHMLINADKSFEILDLSSRGGRAFHGLGTLLTGCKNFEELLELASRGDSTKVDICSNDVLMTDYTENGEENIYPKSTEMKHTTAFFSFGKAVGAKREEFRPEDLAIAWLNYFVADLVQCLTLFAQLRGIKRLFFCGSVCSSPLVGRTQFDFLKPGSYLGALGALITELERLNGDTNGYISHG